jgi:membrane-associated protease RseP (regulator of RpoE activity)
VFVPAWTAVVVGVIVVAGLGFLLGWIAAPSDDATPSNAVAGAPNTPNGQGSPNLPNGRPFPGFPGNGNDNRDDRDRRPSLPTQSGAYLGVYVESADDGARVRRVEPGSPAAEAGLEEGDVITELDGDDVSSTLDLARAVRSHDPGDSITVTYTRDGTSSEVNVTLASTPATRSAS